MVVLLAFKPLSSFYNQSEVFIRLLKLTLITKNIQPVFEAEKFLGYSFGLKGIVGDGGL